MFAVVFVLSKAVSSSFVFLTGVFTATAPHPLMVLEFAVNATVPASGAGVTVAVIVTD